MKRLALRVIRALGYDLVKRGRTAKPGPLSLQMALSRVSQRLPHLETIIDVGASNGMWTQVARSYYPEARYLLIEANSVHERALQNFAAAHPNVQYTLAAAGNAPGDVYFDPADPFGGAASLTPRDDYVRLPMTSIDHEIKTRDLPPPYAIKLDTHGFEVPILEGAVQTLEHTHLLVIETYNFRIEKESLLFYEMCAYLDKRGFRPIDLCDPLFRPHDRSFWQFDLFFVRSDRPEFQYVHYE